MATPAAVLAIQVEANTSKATAALRSFDRATARTGTTAKGATTRTSALNRTTGALGTSMRRAAGYAASAAAAYMSIAQAKQAVTVTQDLAKTTAGLHRNLGITNKQASRWGTVAKARDIDTKSLNMSFTTLSRRLTDAAKGSDTALDSFKDIGLTQRDLAQASGDFNKQVLLVADAFGQAEGGAQRQQAAQKLLGRGYQTLLPMFAEGSKSLKEQMMWADEYGTTMDRKTVKAQMNLVNAQRESKVAMMGLQVSFAKFLTPALEKANEEFQKVARIMSNDKLTEAEKFKKVGDLIAKWGDKALDAFVAILPKLAEKAANAAPKIAGALVKGFANADVWGKVFVSGWLLTKLGGAGFFKGQGKTAGRMFAGAFILALPTLITEAYNLGKKIGHAIEDVLGTGPDWKPDFGKAVKGTGAINTAFPDAVVHGKLGAFKGSAWADAYIQTHKEATEKVEQLRKESVERQRHIEFRGQTDINTILESGFGKNFNTTKRGLDKQEGAFQNTRGKLDNTTKGQTDDVVGNTNSMVNKVGEGLKTLGSNTNKALQAFGAKKVAFAVEAVGSAAKGFQRGGLIPGSGDGDKVHVMAEPGEGFINKSAVKALGGKGAIDAINSTFPRFQKGGTVGGATSGLHPTILSFVSSLYNRFGGTVSSGLRPGTLHGTGQAADYVPSNWAGAAAAVNAAGGSLLEGIYNGHFGGPSVSWKNGNRVDPGFWGGATWADHWDHIHIAIADGAKVAAGKAFATELKKMVLTGPDGPLKSMGQGSLDRSYKAAQAFINSKMPKQGVEGSFAGSFAGASGPIASIAQKMIAARWGASQWSPFLKLKIGESGPNWDPTITNPSSGAGGIPQALPPSKMGSPAWPPTQGRTSIIAQLEWMIDYIGSVYGNPANAYNTWLSRSPHWYGKGGDFIAKRPQLIGVGDGGPERVQVTPLSKGGNYGSPIVNVYVDPVSLETRVETIVEGMAPEIAEFSARQLGRGRGRSRQLAG